MVVDASLLWDVNKCGHQCGPSRKAKKAAAFGGQQPLLFVGFYVGQISKNRLTH